MTSVPKVDRGTMAAPDIGLETPSQRSELVRGIRDALRSRRWWRMKDSRSIGVWYPTRNQPTRDSTTNEASYD